MTWALFFQVYKYNLHFLTDRVIYRVESVYTVTVRGLYAIIFMIICANRMHNRFFFSGAVHVLRAPRLGHVGIIPCISDNTHEQSVDLSDSKEKNNRFFTTQRGTFEKKT
jgi:hypothetical protein